MPTKTKIEWADYVSNPLKATTWQSEHQDGFACVKISEGCAHCWASAMNVRLGTGLEYTRTNMEKVNIWWSAAEEERLLKFKPKGPFKNNRTRPILFLCDMTDLFLEWVEVEYLKRAFNVMEQRQDVDFVILTKRPGRMADFLERSVPFPNVFLGTSVENHERAAQRFGPMERLARRGWRTMASYEPALGRVDWEGWDFLDWLICGGESGNQARPMAYQWARSALDFCLENEIPFFFKQWGEFAPVTDLLAQGCTTFKNRPANVGGEMMVRVGKGMAGNLLDGKAWRAVP